MKHVLVLGTGWASAAKRQAARLIGSTLADAGLGLVCGNSTGIDEWVARSYCGALGARGQPLAGAFCQVSLGAMRFLQRGGLPWPGFAAPPDCRLQVDDVEAWKREAIDRCDAAVMVGGGRGALDISRRVIAAGKPVFPLPFMGGLTGHSDRVFQAVLQTWDSHPVPGISRGQYLSLAEPWVVGTGPLANLLRGTLAEAPDLFISYRRSDAPAASGRLASDLAEHFGQRRVFLDIHGIAPSHAWDATIGGALAASRVGVVVIGRSWLLPATPGALPRLHQPGDVVCREIAQLLAGRHAVFPVLVEGARLPEAAELPEALRGLLRYQAISLGQGDWDSTLRLLVREVEAVLRAPAPATAPAPAPPAQGSPVS